MLLAGLALAAVNVWQRRGRSPAARRWARGHRDFGRRNVLVMWPLLSAALLLGSALGAAGRLGVSTVPWGLAILVVLLAWLAFAVLPIPVPSFVEPRWYREQHADARTDASA